MLSHSKVWFIAGAMLFQTALAPVALAEPVAQTLSEAQRKHVEELSRLPAVPASRGVHVDHSGRKERGRASYYAHHFANRKMADGRRMNPNTNVAASKQLPLGSVAKVTNLANGKTATVKVEDRGPYVNGRVVDLSPKVARELGMHEQGVVPVEVAPITVPTKEGTVKLGAGAATASPAEVKEAVHVTEGLCNCQAEHGEETEASR